MKITELNQPQKEINKPKGPYEEIQAQTTNYIKIKRYQNLNHSI